MSQPVGFFTLTWRIIQRVPDLIELVYKYLGPFLGSGSLIGQILWMVFCVKVIPPLVDFFSEKFPVIFKAVLDKFED